MTKSNESPNEEGLTAAALLWMKSGSGGRWSAPDVYGGRAWATQMHVVREQARRDGVSLDDNAAQFCAHVSGEDTGGERLNRLLEFIEWHPTRYLYVPGSVFADLSDSVRREYSIALSRYGTELIFCD